MILRVSSRLPRFIRYMSNEYPEVKEIAVSIVKNYLTGQWKKADFDNVTVKKLSGGLSNWLYTITLSSLHSQNDHSDPNTVLLRIHGPNYGKFSVDQTITDSLVFMMMSERGLGPKLLGVFSDGRIEEYVSARPLKTHELSDPKISSAIAAKVAHIHSLNVPINKNPESLFDVMIQWLVELKNNEDYYKSENTDIMKEFRRYDLLSEISWLRQHLKKFNSLVVFSHNDLQEGNILITYDSVASDKPNLVLIDYEYCSYNYRGFELANHFLERTMNYSAKEYPYFTTDPSSYPTVEQQEKFIREYLKIFYKLIKMPNICNKIDEANKSQDIVRSDSLEVNDKEAYTLLEEVSQFRLLSHLFWGIWAATHSKSGIDFGFWEYSITRLRAYFKTKEEILRLETETQGEQNLH